MRGPWDDRTFVFRIVTFVLRTGLRTMFRIRLHGMEVFDRPGAFILASNHASFLDPPAVGATVTARHVHFMARDSLFHPPWFGWILRNSGVIPLDRTRGDLGAMRRALQALKEGKGLALFPEGTRSPDGRIQTPKGGIGFLVAKAGVPVIPAYIEGTYDAWPKGRKYPRLFRPIRVYFGPPISPQEIQDEGQGAEAYGRITALIMRRIAALRPEPAREKSVKPVDGGPGPM